MTNAFSTRPGRGARACMTLVVPALLSASAATAHAVTFDLDMLRSRGIDPRLAEYFAKSPRFDKGMQPVTLFVNGSRKGSVLATFNDHGELLFDEVLMARARLLAPDADDFISRFPSTLVELNPNRQEVHLIVPAEALQPAETDFGDFTHGGTAGILNYNLLGLNSRFANSSSTYRSLDTVAGLNAGDWVLRSRQSFATAGESSRLQHLYAYGQRTFTDLQSIIQAGQLNIASSIFSGDAITGIQAIPDSALNRIGRGKGVTVEGMASSTARVEVRQNNALIYTTVVAPGPFTLNDITLLSGNSDLEVSVIEADGSRNSYTVAAASLNAAQTDTAAGFSFALGQYRPYGGGDSDKPFLVTGTGTWRLDHRTGITSGLIGASGYQAAGWALDRGLTPTTNVGIRQVLSSAKKEQVRGSQMLASSNTLISERLSLGLSVTTQTTGYRELAQTTYDIDNPRLDSRYQSQFTAALGWTDKTLGGFRLSQAHARRFDGESTQRLMGSWVKNFKYANVSLNVQKSLSAQGQQDAIQLSVSLPIGGGVAKGFASSNRRKTRTGATYNEQVNEYFGYRLQTEKDVSRRESALSVMANALPRYAQTTLGYSRSGSDSSTWNGSLSGGIVAHDAGITFSPYAVDDTFGLMSVGKVGGVRISTPKGPVWTDYTGKAVAPSLNAFRNNRLEVAPTTLPRNVDILNGFKEVQAGRGSVSRVDFGVVTSRRILMNVQGPDKQPLVKGLSVFDGEGQYVSTVVGGGQIFLPDIEPGTPLSISLPDGKRCSLAYVLPKSPDLSAYFETVSATCNIL